MSLSDLLRGPTALVALSASYVARRPAAAVSGIIDAIVIGARVRRAPILSSRPALLAAREDLAPVCTLVSDTHLTAPDRSPSEYEFDPGQWLWRTLPTGAQLVEGVRRVLADVIERAPRTVVWCGDEVDTGDPEEWAMWKTAVTGFSGLAHHLIPGNHDICFNPPFDEDETLARRKLRERTYQTYGGRLSDFPLVDTIVSDAGLVTVIMLDSCRHPSTHILSNAVGLFGDEQLGELARILDATRGPVLCVTHHHPWRDARFLRPDAWYDTVTDADRLAKILYRYRRRSPRNQVLVCHGHRHTLTAGVIGKPDEAIAVVGLPSTTLGDKSNTGQCDGVVRYAVAGLRRDGSWGVALHDLGPLIEAGEPAIARPATPPSESMRALAVGVRR